MRLLKPVLLVFQNTSSCILQTLLVMPGYAQVTVAELEPDVSAAFYNVTV